MFVFRLFLESSLYYSFLLEQELELYVVFLYNIYGLSYVLDLGINYQGLQVQKINVMYYQGNVNMENQVYFVLFFYKV